MNSYYSASRTAGVTPTGPFLTADAGNKVPTATGWKYTLAPIPAGTLPGTYLVRVYLGNTYADNLATPTVDQVVSIGIVKFQVGTATEDKMIAGNPDGTASCKNCHGSELMHRDDHASPFDPDHCNACHFVGALGNTGAGGVGLGDGNPGATGLGKTAPISNRVHAVHFGSKTGDISVIDWSVANSWNVEVGTAPTHTNFPTSIITYPSNIERCVVCHASGNTSYKNNLYTVPCYGCHADVPGATEHFSTMGGSVASLVSVSTSTVMVPETCGICHKPGETADISD